MVECGIPLKAILGRLSKEEIDISTISACLITHAHGDHSQAARDLARFKIPLFASKETLESLSVEGNILDVNGKNKICDGVYVLPFEVEHDCPGSLGFIIKTKEECVIFVNDHKRWTVDISAFKPNYVFIECNYDHKVVYAQYHALKKKLEEGNLPYQDLVETRQTLKQHERNINSHCSLAGTIKGLNKLNLKNCKAIFLMHLSDRYANEYKMKNIISQKTQVLTYACQKNGGIK